MKQRLQIKNIFNWLPMTNRLFCDRCTKRFCFLSLSPITERMYISFEYPSTISPQISNNYSSNFQQDCCFRMTGLGIFQVGTRIFPDTLTRRTNVHMFYAYVVQPQITNTTHTHLDTHPNFRVERLARGDGRVCTQVYTRKSSANLRALKNTFSVRLDGTHFYEEKNIRGLFFLHPPNSLSLSFFLCFLCVQQSTFLKSNEFGVSQ